MPTAAPVLELAGVEVRRAGRSLLTGVDWRVHPGERWVVLGPNGCGKTTLLSVASLWLHPTAGSVRVLGEELGRTDVRSLRSRIGVVSQALADRLRPELAVRDVVLTARAGALEPWWHAYDDADRAAADEAMARAGVARLADRTFGTLSSGERQRVQVARTLARAPELLLLDEPAAGLDFGGREDLVGRLGGLAGDRASPPMVLVTHHVEEIPPGFTHALLLRDGTVRSAGPLTDTLTARALGDLFDVEVSLDRSDGRWRAWTGGRPAARR